jgi:uncharacterized membrane protein YecN with MAPEG domain
MHSPAVTIVTAGVLGLIFALLSARVVMVRTTSSTLFGQGENESNPLFIACRSHANFAEFVPFCLLLIGGLELHSGSTVLVKVLAAILVLARIAHPIGMAINTSNPYRAGGFIGTMLVIVAGSVAALVTLFT